jgi:hypothetical protein
MIMRAFNELEEQALLAMLAVPPSAWSKIPPRPGNCPYNRLAKWGLATVMVSGPVRRARLTAAGRYFAELVAAVSDIRLVVRDLDKVRDQVRPGDAAGGRQGVEAADRPLVKH